MYKIGVLILGFVVIVVGWAYLISDSGNKELKDIVVSTEQNVKEEPSPVVEEKKVIENGLYKIDVASSVVNWAGKKPLIDGYVNSGTLSLTEGTINIGETETSGSFTIDMRTLKVGLTAKKPNQETKLEEHLKSDRWFDVEKYPTAVFVIKKFTPRTETSSAFGYDIVGDLTMKGVTNEVTFPATIYQTAEGKVVAEAATEIDRTKWGITAGSGSFFDNLADNVVDDMIALSFTLVASK
jgi:polyisoprenoid-binding protein YceI